MARQTVSHTCAFSICLSFSTSVAARLQHEHTKHADHDHAVHAVQRSLPTRWYHDNDHPVHKLFRRQAANNDGETYPAVGSAEWIALWPTGDLPVAADMPDEWKAALKAAEDAGKIPDIPQTTVVKDGQPVYPQGFDGVSDAVCNWGTGCKQPDDIYNGLDGYFAVNFDDGPSDKGSAELYDFLASHEPRIPTTHFVVGRHIRNLPQVYARLVGELDADIAVHTWTHRQLTPLSNEDVMAELAWTMEIIRQSTGGRIPKFWRPPTGDADNRIRAIAKEVLGMDMIMWNQNTDDFTVALITDAAAKQAKYDELETKFHGLIKGPKSPGLIVLEHETSHEAVKMFIDTVPVVETAGWEWASVVQIVGGRVDPNAGYMNVDDEGKVTAGDVVKPEESAAEESAPDNGTNPRSENDGEEPPEGGAQTLVLSYLVASFSAAFGAFLVL